MIREIKPLLQEICNQIREFTDLAVLGMSGGADSTLTAILLKEALGAEKIHSLHLPSSQTDLTHFNKNSLMVANKLGIASQVINIEPVINAMALAAPEIKLSPLNLGNCKARIRMSYLYAQAASLAEKHPQTKVRVIGTGNLSECYIGYDTKGGDGMVDVLPIGELFKSEVYQLLNYFRDEKVIDECMIDRVPSAGLWEGQTDEAELGYSYDSMELSIRKGFTNSLQESTNSTDQFVYRMHLANLHKAQPAPCFALRKFCQ